MLAIGLAVAACGVGSSPELPIGPGTTLMSEEPPTIQVVEPESSLNGLTATLLFAGEHPLIQGIAPIGDDRIFLVEKRGRILVYDAGDVLEEPFLDLESDVLSAGNEQGMLSLAFHPWFHNTGLVYVTYTGLNGDLQVFEYQVSDDSADQLDPQSGKRLLEVPQPHQYHQSGSIVFGPDGYLWLSLGDGGRQNKTRFENAQSPRNILGTVIRIDVDAAEPYAIPPDNPYLDEDAPAARPEVWAYGLRNPWRLAIDENQGLLYIPDVGQEGAEEINVVSLTDGGLNFGWPVVEGSDCLEAPSCDTSGFEMPVHEYEHPGACAIVGGPVYTGASIPELHGTYFFGDYCFGWIHSLRYSLSEGVAEEVDWEPDLGRLGNITSLSTDGQGEILVTNMGGQVWRLDPVRR